MDKIYILYHKGNHCQNISWLSVLFITEMSDECPVPLKSRRKVINDESECIIHDNNTKDKEIKPLTTASIAKIKYVSKAKEVSVLPDVIDPNKHGFHRRCYQIFTNTKYITKEQSSSTIQTPERHQRTSNMSPGTSLFPPECIICKKSSKKIYDKRKNCYEPLTTCVTTISVDSIMASAKQKSDAEMLALSDIDLIAKEAKYHNSCRRDYTRRDSRYPERNEFVTELKRAHSESFNYLIGYIEESIIENCNVERLTMLRERYLSYMQEHFIEYYNEDYKTCKLKEKVQKHFGERIKFWKPNWRGELVYSESVEEGNAIETAFEMATSQSRKLEEAASILRRHILSEYHENKSSVWPPTSDSLQASTAAVPSMLSSFILNVISSKNKSSEKKTELQILYHRIYAMLH